MGELIQGSSFCSALIYIGRNSGISEACTTPSGWIKIDKQAPKLQSEEKKWKQ